MKKDVAIAIVGIFIISLFLISLVSVSARTPIETVKEPNALSSFFGWLKFQTGGLFSVVGNARGCDINAHPSGQPLKTTLYSTPYTVTYVSQSSGNYWAVPSDTTVDIDSSFVTSVCGSPNALIDYFQNWVGQVEGKNTLYFHCPAGKTCQLEIYCCPKAECTSSSDCSGGTCNTVTCTPESGYYRCPNENNILYMNSQYKYCTASTSITCWYRQSNSCYSNTYTTITSCSQTNYMGRPLFSSQSECQGNLGGCSQNEECASGKVCQSGTCVTPTCTPNCAGKSCGDNGCGGSCGTCSSGQTCSNGQCTGGTCTPDCTGKCGGVSNGCGGTCDASCETPSNKGDIRITNIDFPSRASSFLIWRYGDKIKVTVKNFGNIQDTISLEGGYYTPSYAKDVAQLYSIFSVATAEQVPNCNPLETFVRTFQVTLDAGASKEIELNPYPTNVFLLYKTGTYEMKDTDLIVFAGLYEKCLGGYINDAGTTGKGVMYDYQSYILGKGYICPTGLPFILQSSDGEEVGSCKNNVLTITKTFDIPSTTIIQGGGNETIKECNYDSDCDAGYECEEGYCVGTFIDENARQKGIEALKISGMTAKDLSASACTQTTQCQSGSTCLTINSLVSKGYITESKGSELIQSASTIFLGAGAGITSCIAVTSALTISTAGIGSVLFPLCAVGGGAIGLGIQDIFDNFKQQNRDKAGYCIIEGTAQGKTCDFLSKFALFPITKDSCTDGGIILGAIILIGALVFSKL